MYVLSDKGLAALKKLEGFRKEAYLDSVKILTIGVGHVLTASEKESGTLSATGLTWAHGISEDEVLKVLRADVSRFEAGVNQLVKVRLTQPEFDALVCWTFNIGLAAAAKSNLILVLNRSMCHNVPLELAKWTKAGGKTIQGLVNRRAAETKMWSESVYP